MDILNINKLNPVKVFDKDTILHLRIPFSFFLLPVFWFAISQASNIHAIDTILVFVALHFFIYPGSNVYNSYMDEDTGSIGGLEKPPPVTDKLYYASILVDIAGILICLLAGWQFTLILMGYICFSKAYSWHGIRVKKYAWLGLISVMFFQGGYTFMLAHMTATGVIGLDWFTKKNIICMIISSLFIGGYYPLTQIYQHEEDSSRGDITISYTLGIKGSFIFSGILFLTAILLGYYYFSTYYNTYQFLLFIISQLPTICFFTYWFIKCLQTPSAANYGNAMKMTLISSACMIVCFTVILAINQ
jgi:1,4-dihydroxy-2-naphthoate polyprenyltransferase